jgi:hypothetical protein
MCVFPLLTINNCQKFQFLITKDTKDTKIYLKNFFVFFVSFVLKISYCYQPALRRSMWRTGRLRSFMRAWMLAMS